VHVEKKEDWGNSAQGCPEGNTTVYSRKIKRREGFQKTRLSSRAKRTRSDLACWSKEGNRLGGKYSSPFARVGYREREGKRITALPSER